MLFPRPLGRICFLWSAAGGGGGERSIEEYIKCNGAGSLESIEHIYIAD